MASSRLTGRRSQTIHSGSHGDCMTDPISFLLAALALLAAPGPTNTLLMTSGATAGLARSWTLVPAAAVGYSLGTLLLAVAVRPLLGASPWIDAAMRLGCAGLLVALAIMMWREGSDMVRKGEPVRLTRMVTATLLNPKNIVFGLVIVPHLNDGRLLQAAPYMVTLAAMALAVGLAWCGAGAAARATVRDRIDTGILRKTGAGFLALFGVLMAGSALTVGAG
jgi:threonine/homoserine/homoserine lactone efflux protein